jgi:hypothetical protein|nr:hypothetical protein [Serratia fonticola]
MHGTKTGLFTVPLNTLSKYFIGKMLVSRHFKAITPSTDADYQLNIEEDPNCQQLAAQSQCCQALLPTNPLLIEFADECHVCLTDCRGCYSLCREFLEARITVLMPIFTVLVVSRTPAPLKPYQRFAL